jgi:F-type H+-transporting ATPase subunit alpha
VREILKQPQYRPLPVPEQIAALVAVNEGVLDEVPIDGVAAAEKDIRREVTESLPDLCRSIESGEELGDEDVQNLADHARQALRQEPSEGRAEQAPEKGEKT